MTRVLVALSFLGAFSWGALAQEYVSPGGFDPILVPRPGEPQATYSLLDVTRGKGTRDVVFVTKRVGPSGITYTRRWANCDTLQSQTLGTGSTPAEMMIGRPDPNAVVAVQGSSAALTTARACLALGM